MIDPTVSAWAVPLLIFLSVGLFGFFIAASLLEGRKVRDRYAAAFAGGAVANGVPQNAADRRFHVDAKKLGLDAEANKKLRNDLIRAGYFAPNAVLIYMIVRTVLVILLPLAAYLAVLTYFGHLHGLLKFLIVAGAFLVSYYLGKAYLGRRQRLLENEHRLFFPDFLDMLVVCVDAGLSLEAALERVALEIDTSQRAFRINLQLMMAEMRAGKRTIDALKAFSERLGLEEAASLATLLQQSLELGTDVSASLSTYSEEMRDKRMSRAEQKAFALPVKITLPLALFILPTIFIAIMTPAVIKMSTTLFK
ncbi:type II secretion protein F [Microvirga sp. KLBC 81]|uniref:type II secretion system F family protein n=1 Tax=Microvirga sp. KLBC 81 TaxID=1862707 RepID=UPI000D511C32|nr:type II secretion system F family protein [Microvirga sp. KLBC 81]PVE25667.1 type II secretion protein F [Microvirga sp. KLBC 81]